jgi:ABC-type antimicrobial peptide transport system permease subunit
MVGLEMASTIAVALAVGGAIVAVAVAGVSRGVTGVPLELPGTPTALLLAGAAGLGLAATVVAARLALRTSPAAAMRARD